MANRLLRKSSKHRPLQLSRRRTDKTLIANMAKQEIVKRTLNLFKIAWWKWMPGTSFLVRWPNGWHDICEPVDGARTQADTSDPNIAYRWYLEKYVGKQGRDWDWMLAPNDPEGQYLLIKIRRPKARYASILAMRWN